MAQPENINGVAPFGVDPVLSSLRCSLLPTPKKNKISHVEQIAARKIYPSIPPYIGANHMAVIVRFTPNFAFTDGAFAPGAKVSFFLTGTTTPVTVYTDEARTIAHPTPLVADAAGQFPIVWGENGVNLKAVVTAADDSAIDTYDPVVLGNIDAQAASSISFTPVAGNAATEVQDAIANNTADILTVPTQIADYVDPRVSPLDTFDMTGETEWESPTLTTDYIGYRIKIVNAEIASAGTVALLGLSTDDGTSYDTGNFSTTTYVDTGSGGPGNLTTGQLWSGEALSVEDFNLDVEIMRPDEAAFTTGRFEGWSSTASGHDVQKGHFTHRVAASINKIRLSDLEAPTSGTLYLFGIRA